MLTRLFFVALFLALLPAVACAAEPAKHYAVSIQLVDTNKGWIAWAPAQYCMIYGRHTASCSNSDPNGSHVQIKSNRYTHQDCNVYYVRKGNTFHLLRDTGPCQAKESNGFIFVTVY